MEAQQLTDFYTYLQSQTNAQHFLRNCYQKLGGVDADVKSFENTHAFMNYFDHGLRFYETGRKLETLLQPILLFYGMGHLLKAALLTVRPDYPESTAILAHGVSARKRKRKDYTFMTDDVKIQHNGLYPYVANHLFAMDESPFNKIKMQKLLSLIPEMHHLWALQSNQKLVIVGHPGSQTLHFPITLLDSYHETAHTFQKRISPHIPTVKEQKTTHAEIQLTLAEPFYAKANSPFFLDQTQQSLYFPASRDDFLPIPELMLHYLLLYNLSMLSRYEPEWWGDLLNVRPDQDYSFVKTFLNTTSQKVPLMIGQFLQHKHQGLTQSRTTRE